MKHSSYARIYAFFILPGFFSLVAMLALAHSSPGVAEGLRPQGGWSNMQQHQSLQAFHNRFGIHVTERPDGYKQNDCDRVSDGTLSDLMDTAYMPQNKGYDWKYHASSIGSPVDHETANDDSSISLRSGSDEMILSADDRPSTQRPSASSHAKSYGSDLSDPDPLECFYK